MRVISLPPSRSFHSSLHCLFCRLLTHLVFPSPPIVSLLNHISNSLSETISISLPPSLSFLSISQNVSEYPCLGLQLTLTFPIYLSIYIYIYLSICLSGCLSWLRGCRWVGGGGQVIMSTISICLSVYLSIIRVSCLYPCPSTLCSPSVGLRAWLMERWSVKVSFFTPSMGHWWECYSAALGYYFLKRTKTFKMSTRDWQSDIY